MELLRDVTGVGRGREGIAKPWIIIRGITSSFLFLVVILILTHESSHARMVPPYELMSNKYLTRGVRINLGDAQYILAHHSVGRGIAIVHSFRVIHQPNPHKKPPSISQPLPRGRLGVWELTKMP